jgi:hypothetical protein
MGYRLHLRHHSYTNTDTYSNTYSNTYTNTDPYTNAYPNASTHALTSRNYSSYRLGPLRERKRHLHNQQHRDGPLRHDQCLRMETDERRDQLR